MDYCVVLVTVSSETEAQAMPALWSRRDSRPASTLSRVSPRSIDGKKKSARTGNSFSSSRPRGRRWRRYANGSCTCIAMRYLK